MRDASDRQLFLRQNTGRMFLSSLCWCALIAAQSSFAASAGLEGELRAAKIIASAALTKADPDKPTSEEVEKVSRIYQQLIEQNPRSADARNDYAEFLWAVSRHEDALAQWKEAEKIAPENAALADALGAAYLAMGDTKLGTVHLERAAKLEPANPRYHYKLGNAIYLFRHELVGVIDQTEAAVLAQAVEHLRKAAELEPQNAQYAAGYAETFYGIPQPDWHAALLAWQHFLEVTSDKDFAYVQLARVNLKLGRKQEARELVSKIQGVDFGPAKVRLLNQIGAEAPVP